MASLDDKINCVLGSIEDLEGKAEALKELVDEMKTLIAAWTELDNCVDDNISKLPNVITLDVGGTIYKATKETLLRFEGSYFHALLGSGRWNPDSSDGAYYLDLNGGVPFQRVMVYLRSGEMSFAGLNGWESRQVESILEYLKLPQSCCKWDANFCGETYALSCDDRSVEMKETSSVAKSSILANAAVKSVKMRLDSGGYLMYVGLAPKKGFDPKSRCEYELGYGIHMGSGHLFQLESKQSSPSVNGSFRAGDVLGMFCLDHEIVFEKNDRKIGCIKIDTSTKELFPFAALSKPGDKLTILN
ncbi:unnamed protein product [Aphanomyces euteiches]|uniref:Potassium channel tetramerisation-type BTB domain-containing protein n=1 Tax=Aphanomyces euteiches TaxID=100861 RepID=A0A6G0X4K8_9STRA|nr:hypothetical protein Ae201684_008518 [Aphanomyces euteiches]KAH9085347.1 hypothetical protein Ae201684P_005056 [Aphanomyces euteiches]